MQNEKCWLGVRPVWKQVRATPPEFDDEGNEVVAAIPPHREQTGWEAWTENREVAVTTNLQKVAEGDDYFEGFRYFEVTISDAGKPKLTEVTS